jgi:8-oxo-dGTP pyrophosphatase MutT (NUDIX family)
MLTTSSVIQAAAIPLHGRQVCLVQSSSGKRWTIPKGSVEAEQTLEQTALREAWEEAGILGVLTSGPVGTYAYEKLDRTCLVSVYLMQVTEVADRWPESFRRMRIWVSPSEVLLHVNEPNLRRVLQSVLSGRRLPSHVEGHAG